MINIKQAFTKNFVLSLILAGGIVFLFHHRLYAMDVGLNDRDITNAVELEYLTEPVVPADRLNVRTMNGIVTLSGIVDNILAKEKAIAIAQSIKGVRSVVDELAVAPSDISDADLRDRVENAVL